MSNQTTAIATYETLKDLVSNNASIQERFEAALGPRYRPFLASLVNLVYLDENLQNCEPLSILASAMKAATLDLKIDKELGQAWIIPYKIYDKKARKERNIAQFQIGYKGFVQMALRTKEYDRLNVAPIYQGETVVEDRLTGDIRIEGEKTSPDVTGWCGYFRLKSGFQKFYYMTVDEIHAHAQKYSKSYGFEKGAWKTNTIDMEKKTILSALLRKYGLLSAAIPEPEYLEDAEPVDEPQDLAGIIDARAEDSEQQPEETQPEASGNNGQFAF